MIDDIINRLKTNAPLLKTRIDGAANYASLVAKKQLPNKTPAAHVLPIGIDGGAVESATGQFQQATTETFGVLITVRSSDRVGSDQLEPIDALKREVIEALCGWAPNDEVGVFQLRRGVIRSVLADAITYELDFSIGDQIRILTHA